MERLIVNTGLDGFTMPDKVTTLNDTTVAAVKSLDTKNDNDLIKIETMAQVCALHTRFRFNFDKHAFLLKIDEYKTISALSGNGEILIRATIVSAAKEAFSYSVRALHGEKEIFNGRLLIAVTNYSETFNKKELTKHYRKLFLCLTKDL